MDLWVFDNDGTLYDDSGTHKRFMEIFCRYCSVLLGVTAEKVSKEVAKLKTKWNTEFSVIAIMREFGVDYTELVNQTYLKIELEKCNVIADHVRQETLRSLEAPKIVFTNNPSQFAKKVLGHLGLADLFMDIVGMEETNFFGKLNPAAFKIIGQRHPKANRFIFCDDLLKNLEVARELGWITIWYKQPGNKEPASTRHTTISSFEELKSVTL